MAVSGTITKVTDSFGCRIITITGFNGVGNVTPLFASEGMPYGSAQIVLTAGNATSVSIALQGSNDGVSANVVALGSPATTFPGISPLAVSGLDAPARFYQFALSGGDGTGTFTITCVLMAAGGV